MTQITYSGLTPGAPENVNDLNTKLLEVKTVVNGNLDSGNLAANSVGTSEIQDGSVTAAKLASAVGAPLAVTSQVKVGNTGDTTGLYPGRILASTDFTGLGLSTPIGLYNLSSTSDSSGNGRTLTNKGSVTFDTGITGSASTAALFTGSTAQAFYIVDTGASDPFRIKSGSFGCWFKTAKRGTAQMLVTKWGASDAVSGWRLDINSSNAVETTVDSGTGSTTATGVTDVCDDRWHHVVGVHDGTVLRTYVDGVLETTAVAAFVLNQGASAPFNIGGQTADAGTAASNPHFGRIDEVFVTSDVLSDDEVRFLYCSKVAHAYPSTPKQTWVQVRRQRRGADLATTDFPSTPARLYAGGSLVDLGSNATNVTANNSPVILAGPDGVGTKAYNFILGSSQSLSSTDTGLPTGTNSSSMGCWFKTGTTGTTMVLLSYGTATTNERSLYIDLGGSGTFRWIDGPNNIAGPFAADTQWHFGVAVIDNSALDGLKVKLYMDGRLVGSSTSLASTTLIGANGFRVGCRTGATSFFTGQIGPSFVISAALTPAQVWTLYDKSSQALTASPKNEGDNIEAMDSTYLYLDTSTLQSNSLVDIQVQG